MKASWLVALMAANFLFRASLALEPAVVAEEISAAMVEVLGSEFAAAAEELRQSDEAVLVRRLYAGRASNLIGVRDGIERFCDDVGVPAPKLLSFERNCLPLWESASELALAHASEDATADVVYNTLVASWNAFVRNGDDSAEASARVA